MRGLPYVPFFTSDWLASSARVDMTLPERAVYLDLLFHIWERGGAIPSDHAKLAKLAFVTPEEFERVWPAVGAHIIQHPDEPDALTNLKMLDVIRKQAANFQAKSNSGRLGGVASGITRKRKRTENEAKRNQSEPETEPELETEKSLSESSSCISSFKASSHASREEFISAYPKSTGLTAARAVYAATITTPEQHAELMAGLRLWLESEQWTRSLNEDRGRFVPNASRFISEQLWRDKPPQGRGDAFEQAAKMLGIENALDECS
jgi:uncharacterized protein YdaU (DUF1376 family)